MRWARSPNLRSRRSRRIRRTGRNIWIIGDNGCQPSLSDLRRWIRDGEFFIGRDLTRQGSGSSLERSSPAGNTPSCRGRELERGPGCVERERDVLIYMLNRTHSIVVLLGFALLCCARICSAHPLLQGALTVTITPDHVSVV